MQQKQLLWPYPAPLTQPALMSYLPGDLPQADELFMDVVLTPDRALHKALLQRSACDCSMYCRRSSASCGMLRFGNTCSLAFPARYPAWEGIAQEHYIQWSAINLYNAQ